LAIKVRLYVTVNTNYYEIVTHRLKTLDVKIEHYENDPSHLIGTVYVPSNQPLKIIDLINLYYQIEGVLKINADHAQESDKGLWYKHPIIPMVITAGLTAVTIFSVLHDLKLSVRWEVYFYLIGVPTIVSFFTGLLYKYF